jgi:phosphoenolpyruvate synthase/pyruvate phosphate dikinase
MIKVHLDKIIAQLDKTPTEISKEVGLTRKTLYSLMQGKAKGLQFETLDRLCRRYGLRIDEVVEYVVEETEGPGRARCKQEFEGVPITVWMPSLGVAAMNQTFFGTRTYAPVDVFFKQGYCEVYWTMARMKEMAPFIYRTYGLPSETERLYAAYLATAVKVEKIYANHAGDDFRSYGAGDVQRLFTEIEDASREFWRMSIFIDSFDFGFDAETIAAIKEKHGFSAEEVAVLTTPAQMTFNDERLLAVLQLTRAFKTAGGKPENLAAFIAQNAGARQYLRHYAFCGANYARPGILTAEDLRAEMAKYLADGDLLRDELGRLTGYAVAKDAAVRRVLSRHRLKANPLTFFSRLTYWREHRKMITLMSINLVFGLLDGVEALTGIPHRDAAYASLDEVGAVLKGTVSGEMLRARREQGYLVSHDEDAYRVLTGPQAQSLRDQVEASMAGTGELSTVISGTVASQGYAKGVACVILRAEDFGKFKEGEILVTTMTRPEFLPLMKLAAGIVTGEGGITCHAAIVSRELGKPCIIGAKNATKLIHDGDLVEVRANHGTVRILERRAN